MTIDEVFELRNQGYKEKAYEAARAIYAVDKGPYASAAMFWTAIDMLKVKVNKDQIEDAKKIYLALERLLNSMNDEKGWMHDAFERCHVLIEKGEKRANLSYEGPKHLQTGIWGEELAVEYVSAGSDQQGFIIAEAVVELRYGFLRSVFAENSFGGGGADDVKKDKCKHKHPDCCRDGFKYPFQRVFEHRGAEEWLDI